MTGSPLFGRPCWVCTALVLGCAGPSPPEPVEPLVERGRAPGNETVDLMATLGRATEPRVTEMRVTGGALHFRSLMAMYGVPGIPLGDVERETTIRFDNITKVEALEDANVVVELIGGRVERIRFATREDARRFAGLLLGLRAAAGRGP